MTAGRVARFHTDPLHTMGERQPRPDFAERLRANG